MIVGLRTEAVAVPDAERVMSPWTTKRILAA